MYSERSGIRQNLQGILVTLAVLGIFMGCGKPTPTPTRPNLLIITLDTTRADFIGSYGKKDAQTPSIDALAAQGAQFMHNIAPSQCTNPSHASILTGLYPARHTVYDNATPLPESASTLAEIYRDAGYRTLGAVSARHLNPENSNFGQGMQTFLNCEPVQITAGERNKTFLPELRRLASGAPFFAWVHYFDPHSSYDPPPPYDTLHDVRDEHAPLPPRRSMEIGEAKLLPLIDPDEFISLYEGEISYVDSEIARTLEVLDELGVAENTIVVLVADHGESLTEKDIYFCHAGMYEQVLHVPLIVRWPGHIVAGTTVETTTSSVDIVPTLLSLTSIEFDQEDYSGKSLVPALSSPTHNTHEAVFSESVAGVIRSVYTDGFKYMKPYPSDWALKEPRLYRYLDDAGETKELSEVNPAVAQTLDHLLDDWVTRATERSLTAVEGHEMDAATEEALRSLGYIE